MYEIEGYEWAIYGLCMLSVILLGQFLFVKPKAKFKYPFLIVKIVCITIFVITSTYWIVTFPHIGWNYNFSDNKNNYSQTVDIESIKTDVDKNRKRIEILERELEQTQNELKAVVGRITLLLRIAMYGLLYFGIGYGVRLYQKNKVENKDSLNL